MENNIYNELKKELGFRNVSNQYIELAIRLFSKEHSSESIKELARQEQLSICDLDENYYTRIAQEYIIGVQTCFEAFLLNFKDLIGNPTEKSEPYDAKLNDNRLKWTLSACYHKDNLSDEINQLYQICNYYRLVRNEIIHNRNSKHSSDYRNALSRIQNVCSSNSALKYSNLTRKGLNAPNCVEKICFDDQILFSRAVERIAGAIYKDAYYDWEEILDKYQSPLQKCVSQVRDNKDKCKSRIISYLNQIYPAINNPELNSLLETKLN